MSKVLTNLPTAISELRTAPGPVDKVEEDDVITPEDGQVGQLVKEYTLDEMVGFLPDFKSNLEYMFITGNPIVLFQWVKNGKKHQILVNKGSLSTPPPSTFDKRLVRLI